MPDEDALPYDDGYYWRAMVKDAAGNPSAWSEPRSLTVTFQNLPVSGLYTNDPTPTFSWYAVPGATGYKLIVIQDPGYPTEPALPGYTSIKSRSIGDEQYSNHRSITGAGTVPVACRILLRGWSYWGNILT